MSVFEFDACGGGVKRVENLSDVILERDAARRERNAARDALMLADRIAWRKHLYDLKTVAGFVESRRDEKDLGNRLAEAVMERDDMAERLAVACDERDAAICAAADYDTQRSDAIRERDQARVACSEALSEANQRASDLCAALRELAGLRMGMMDLLGCDSGAVSCKKPATIESLLLPIDQAPKDGWPVLLFGISIGGISGQKNVDWARRGWRNCARNCWYSHNEGEMFGATHFVYLPYSASEQARMGGAA